MHSAALLLLLPESWTSPLFFSFFFTFFLFFCVWKRTWFLPPFLDIWIIWLHLHFASPSSSSSIGQWQFFFLWHYWVWTCWENSYALRIGKGIPSGCYLWNEALLGVVAVVPDNSKWVCLPPGSGTPLKIATTFAFDVLLTEFVSCKWAVERSVQRVGNHNFLVSRLIVFFSPFDLWDRTITPPTPQTGSMWQTNLGQFGLLWNAPPITLKTLNRSLWILDLSSFQKPLNPKILNP